MKSQNLTATQVLYRAEQIDRNLLALAQTAPQTVASLGGRDGISRLCEMTCIGPIPRLDASTWEQMSREFQDNREHGSTRGD